MIRSTLRTTLISLPCLLTACVVIGPTVPVTPAAGRSQAAFAEDRRACMAMTDQQVQPVADRSVTGPVAGRAGALSTTDLQHRYDATYGTCMAARGNLVAQAPVVPPTYALGPQPNRGGLDDPDSRSARQALTEEMRSFQRSCPGERIVMTVTDAPLAPSMTARLVALTTPYGGSCFGQPGQNTYLVARSPLGWTRLSAAEPGSIDVLATEYQGYRDIRHNFLGLCTYWYAWDGRRYMQTGSDQCATSAPPTLGSLTASIRSGGTSTGKAAACPATAAGRQASRFLATLFQGNPSQNMSLAPDGMRTSPAGSAVPTWHLPAGGGYVLACHYDSAPDVLVTLDASAHDCGQEGKSFVCR